MELFYTVHARQRMSLRVVSEKEVIDALEQGTLNHLEDDKLEAIHKNVRVVFVLDESSNTVIIITVIHSKPFSKQVKKYARKHKCSLRQATLKLKKCEVA